MSGDGLHERFLAWLEAGADGEPARDLALHASVCIECARWVAAHDALATIDPGRAPLPSSRPAAIALPAGPRRVARWAATVSLVVAIGLLAVGVGEVLSGGIVLFPHTEGGVLAATGTPAPSAHGGGSLRSATTAPSTDPVSPNPASSRVTPSPTPTPSAAPRSGTTAARTSAPRRSVPEAPSPTPRVTPSPTVVPSPTPSASPTPSPSPSPTPSASPSPTPSASPSPSPTPIVSPSPTPTATQAPTASPSAS